MPPQTIKRQAEDVSFHNDDLVDDVYNNVTLGGKKSRFHYTCTLQSQSDLFENNVSDQTESIQSTITNSSCCECGSDCDCSYESSSHSDLTEFNVSKNLNPCFKTCLMCKQNNTNPYFQYCHKCFKYRLKLFESYPDPQPKSIKRLNIVVNHIKESNVHKDSQETGTSNSQESGSFGLSSLWLSQENTTDTKCKSENSVNTCNICLIREKNGLFNHGKTSHVYSCYTCAKLLWSRTGKCPICNVKIRSVTKLFKYF